MVLPLFFLYFSVHSEPREENQLTQSIEDILMQPYFYKHHYKRLIVIPHALIWLRHITPWVSSMVQVHQQNFFCLLKFCKTAAAQHAAPSQLMIVKPPLTLSTVSQSQQHASRLQREIVGSQTDRNYCLQKQIPKN